MAAITACPTEQQMQRLLQGRGAATDEEAFAAHLEHCQACAERLDPLVKHDTLTDAVRAQSTVYESLSDPDVQRLLDRLLQSKPGGPGPSTLAPQNLRDDKTPAPAAAGSLPAMRPSLSGSRTEAAGPDASSPTYDFLAPPQAADEIGRLGPYRVLQVLGYGGMGVVFKAEDPHLQRLVALKAMLPAVAAKASAKERFLREARAAAGIKHDHIIGIYTVGEDRGTPYMAMELLEGQALDQWLKGKDKLPLTDILRIGRETASGLAAAHKRSLIHRDIKPGNLWLETTGSDDDKDMTIAGGAAAFALPPSSRAARVKLKILDFGLARSRDDQTQLTQSGTIVGTPAYMAPEQANGSQVDHRCDLFSLGCILYRMSTGVLPFIGEDTLSLLTSLAMDRPAAPIELNADIPQELSDLILRLLAKNPADRPESAQAVVATLTQLEADLNAPTRSTPAPKHRPSRQPARTKRRLLASAVGLAAVVLLVAGTVFFLQTPKGTVRLEINDDSLEAVLTSDGAIIKGADKGHDIKVAAGEQGLKIKRGDLEFETDKFILKKGDTVTVKVELLPSRIQVVQGDKVIGVKDLPQAGKGTPPVDSPTVRASFVSLDKLDPAKIPEAERYPWQPRELVAVVGESRGRSWNDPSGHTRTVIWSSDGKYVAIAGASGVVLWDPQTLRPTATLPGLENLGIHSPNAAAFSPDARTLAAVQDNAIKLYDLDGNEPKLRTIIQMPEGLAPTCLAFAPNGKTLAGGMTDTKANNPIQLWDLSARNPVDKALINGHAQQVVSLAFAPDGKTLASMSQEEKIARLWDLSGAEPKARTSMKVETPRERWAGVAFALDGKMLVTGGPQTPGTAFTKIQMWDLAGAEPKVKFALEAHENMGCAVSPSGTMVALGAGQGLELYDVTGEKPVTIGKIQRGGYSWLAFSPDNKTVITTFNGSNEFLELFDLKEKELRPRRELVGHSHGLTSAVLAPNGKTLATSAESDPVVRLWDMTGSSPRPRAELRQSDSVFTIAFSPDSNTLAVAAAWGVVQLWDVPAAERRQRHVIGVVGDNVSQLTFTPDGKTLACYQPNPNAITLLDVSGEELKTGPVFSRSAFPMFSPDGKTMSSLRKLEKLNDWQVVLWDLSGAEPKVRTRSEGSLGLLTAAFSPDGKLLARCHPPTEGRNPVHILRLSGTTFKEWYACEGPWWLVPAITFAPNSNILAYCGHYGDVVVWDVARSIPLKTWRLPGEVRGLSFAPDGRHLITANKNGTAYVLRLSDPDTKPPDKP